MEVSNLGVQQANLQTAAGVSMLKQHAKTEQALVSMITESVQSSCRGQNLDICA